MRRNTTQILPADDTLIAGHEGPRVASAAIRRAEHPRRGAAAYGESVAQLLPIFPLDTVLLPGAPLPLHIFELRYRALVADVWGARTPGGDQPGFGIVALNTVGTGSDVRGPGRPQRLTAAPEVAHATAPAEGSNSDDHDEPTIEEQPDGTELASVGTVATIIEMEPYDDGRCDLLTIGSRRFRLLEIDATSKPYLQAQVEWLPEEVGPVSEPLAEAARVRCGRYLAALAELAGRELPPIEFAADAVELSYQVAGRMRLANGERQTLLEALTAAERLGGALRLLRREIVLLGRTRSVPVSPGLLQVESRPN
jgi:uncharacterized protein